MYRGMKGLFCIARCHLDDQTCSYRCLLKYDSWLITKFSSCAFEKQTLEWSIDGGFCRSMCYDFFEGSFWRCFMFHAASYIFSKWFLKAKGSAPFLYWISGMSWTSTRFLQSYLLWDHLKLGEVLLFVDLEVFGGWQMWASSQELVYFGNMCPVQESKTQRCFAVLPIYHWIYELQIIIYYIYIIYLPSSPASPPQALPNEDGNNL